LAPFDLLLLFQGETVFAYFNPLTGELHSGSPFRRPFRVIHSAKLATVASHHTHFVLAVDDSLVAHIFPEEEASHLVVQEPVHFFLWNSSSLAGFQVSQTASKGLKTVCTWQLPFAEDESVLNVAERDPQERVASLGRVLGNRNVLYKYLNPHTIAVGTFSSELPFYFCYFFSFLFFFTSSGRTNLFFFFFSLSLEGKELLSVYLVDSVSGSVLSHHYHEASTPAVAMVICENWLVYHYWNKREQQYELSVHEFYESTTQDKRQETNDFTSFSGFVPEILSQSYVFPTGVTAMGVTQTKRGITSRMLVLALATGEIFGLPKRILDPRRPSGVPTNDDREEGLIPYDVLIPINPKAVLSYNQTVRTKSLALCSCHFLSSHSFRRFLALQRLFPLRPVSSRLPWFSRTASTSFTPRRHPQKSLTPSPRSFSTRCSWEPSPS